MKYIVTNIQYNAGINKKFLQNIKAFAKVHGVTNLLTFVQNGSYKEHDEIDQEVFYGGFETIDSLSLNNNLRLKDMKIPAQQINPMTGMATKLSRDYSYIMPSAKIRYLSVANTSNKPRAMMTTGNLTKPNYKLHTAQGRKAQEQHEFGFVYVEVLNKTKFITHNVRATKNGNFHYLGERYKDGKLTSVPPESLTLGDWHLYALNKKARAYSIKQIEDLQPKRVVFHDFFDGHTINPHKQGHLIEALFDAKHQKDSLENELKAVYKEMQFFSKKFPHIQFLVAESNHDIFLRRYIDSKMFMEHPKNFMHIIKMIPEMLEDKKPTLQIGLELFGKIPSNFYFGREDEDYRIRGVGILTHGHNGINGSRGISVSFSNHNLELITGHTHSPGLYANGMTVGTNTDLKQRYMKGASSQAHANGILYADGKYTLLPFAF